MHFGDSIHEIRFEALDDDQACLIADSFEWTLLGEWIENIDIDEETVAMLEMQIKRPMLH